MPELPEVETVRRSLAPALGRVVAAVHTSRLPLRQKPLQTRRMRKLLIGQSLDAIDRRGKYLLARFGANTLVVHLGMSGRWLLQSVDTPTDKHCHVVLRFEAEQLVFRDPRRFGQVTVLGQGESLAAIDALGPDPLIEGVSLWRAFRRRRGAVKTVLLNQRVIAGIGNIYASEALWRAKIAPTVPAYQLSQNAVKRLNHAVEKALTDALTRGGTSLRDFVDGYGAQGDNSHYLRVYGRGEERCLRRGCHGIIEQFTQAGRSTFWCPSCQRHDDAG